MSNLWDNLLMFSSAIEKVNNETENSKVEILTAEKLEKLYWMSADKLALIYGNGTKKVQLDDDPEVYDKLFWFSKDKLKAIFGDNSPKKE